MELHILGTASARPTSIRNVSGSVLSTEEGLVVIDAGEGFQIRYSAQRGLMKRSDQTASLRPHKIAVIALTHGHLDHTWGLLPFLQTLALDGSPNIQRTSYPNSVEFAPSWNQALY